MTLSLVEKARMLATLVHDGQTDKAGRPYILHPERVAKAVAHLGEECEAVGWLHDAQEAVTDAGWERGWFLGAMKHLGFPFGVREAVSVLTRREPAYLTHYIPSIKRSENPHVRPVKVADIKDNLRPGCPGSLRKRYERALQILGEKP